GSRASRVAGHSSSFSSHQTKRSMAPCRSVRVRRLHPWLLPSESQRETARRRSKLRPVAGGEVALFPPKEVALLVIFGSILHTRTEPPEQGSCSISCSKWERAP